MAMRSEVASSAMRDRVALDWTSGNSDAVMNVVKISVYESIVCKVLAKVNNDICVGRKSAL